MIDPNIKRLDFIDLRGLDYLIFISLSTILDADYDDTNVYPTDNIYLSFTPAGVAAGRNKGKRRANSEAKPVS